MYKDLPDKKFFDLIFTSADALGMDYIEEARRRSDNIVPFLSSVLSEKKNFASKTKRFWAVVHAVHILGILGDLRGFGGLVSAGRFADKYSIDWIWEALPECYLRLGTEAIPLLMEHIEKEKASAYEVVVNEIYGLWNFWDAYPEERERIEAFLLPILKNPATNPETRTNLIADFSQIGRSDLKPLFEEYYERGEADLETLPRADMEYFFENVHRAPGHRQDLESFYDSEEIEKRQERWEKERKESDQKAVEEYILEEFRNISRNDPCPCGSGKKFKKCHLEWAEKERFRLREEEESDGDFRIVRGAISAERHSETSIRKFLARKNLTNLFLEIKAKALEVIKAPDYELKSQGLGAYFEGIFSKIDFKSKREAEEFMTIFFDYYNALAQQFPPDYPRNGEAFH